MPFSKESVDNFALRRRHLDTLKSRTKIGIFGSFAKERKDDLHELKKYLRDNGYDARISEDLDERSGTERRIRDPVYDRKLSEKLIRESDIHIFVLPREHAGEPSNLAQSVSMEIERLHTLSECGQKSDLHVAIYAETGLIGTMGSVCEGLVLSKDGDWNVEEYNRIQEIFRSARQFCLNSIQEIYCY